MPNLLHSTSVPVPQFASVSLLLNDDRAPGVGADVDEGPLGGGAGVDTAVLVASPWATLPHRTVLDCLDELHRHLSGLHPGGVGGNDGGDDGRKGGEVDGESDGAAAVVQVHRSRAGNGVGLHHLLVTDRSLVDRCSAVLLGGGVADAASSSSSTKNGGSSGGGGKKMAAGQERAPSERGKSSTAGARGGGANGAADNVVAGVVLCVAVSGSSHALHGPCSAVSSDSHLRLRESVPLLTRLLKQSLSTAAAASESAAASRGGSRGKRGGHKQRAGAGGGAGDAPAPSSAAEGQEQGRKWIRVLLASLLSDDDGGGSGADASSSPASASAPTRTRGSSPTLGITASGGTSRHHHHHPSLSSEAGGASYFFRRTPRGGMPTTPPAGAGAAGADPGITTLTVVRAAATTTPRSAPRRHQSLPSRHRHRRPRSTIRSNPAGAAACCRLEAERMQVLAVSDASGDMDFGFASEAAAGLALLRRRRAQGGGGRAGRRTAAAGLEAGPDGSFDYVPPPAPAPPPPPPPPIHSSPVGAMTAATFAAGPSPRTAVTVGGAARTIVFPPSPSSPSPSPSPSPSSPASLRARLRRASSGGSAASGRMAAAAPRWPSSSELSGGGGSGGGGGSFRRRAEQRRAQQVGAQAQPVRSGSASSLGGGGGGGKSDGSAAEAPAGPWTASFDGPAAAAAGSGREDVVANGGDVRGEGRRRRRSGPGPGADGPGGDRDRGHGQGHPPSSLQRALRSSSSSPEPTAAASSGVGGGSGARRGGEGRGGESEGKGGRDGDGNKAAAVMTVSVALNEDLTCSYRRSKLVSLCIEGLVQVRASSASTSTSTSSSTRSGGDDPDVVPFHLIMRDPLRHIRTVQESRAYVRDVTAEEEEGRRRRLRDGVGTDNGDAAQRTYVVTLPKRDQYFPVVKYKCGDELCPVPVRVQTKVKFQGGTHCRVALQISSNPVNRANLSDLTIVMGVPSPFLGGETLTTSPAGGVWDGERRQVSWCVAELGSGEKFQLQAQFGTRTIGGEDVDKDDVEFPVSVRCHCMYAQLSRVELGVRRADAAAATSSSSSSTDVKMKLARRYRISHRERS